ncbi:MAG: filamentous hemagglutinin N-terminal domain-containing protein, partial [Verrucomicrobia bacterium]|nr:filamentous hemagglutinin N-terminal domain-containing protein [Verrucomicrobiota bacterium]
MKFLHLQTFFRALAVFAMVISLAGIPRVVQANPSGEIVINGSFKIEDLGSTLKIIQGSKNGIIHWDDFSIRAGEITQFIQPGSSASVLNRVTGSARSEIMGQLLANGNVWVINPNGILVGPGARVDVGGLILSTLDISNEDFLRGGDFRFSGGSQEAVINQGTIRAAGGDVYVMAQRVENHGFIGAMDGRVVLAADNEVLIKQGAEGNVFLSGQVGHGHVLNNGEVVAADVAMMARNNNVYAMAVQNNGIARAQTVEKSGGRIRLVAQGGAGVDQAGTVNVDGSRGGKVEIASDGAVRLAGTTTARGTTDGGGEIVVGSMQAGGGVQVGAGASVDASTLGGKGGSVEMTSAGALRNEGLVSAASAQGAGGSVRATGSEVEMAATSRVDVSGETDGGAIFVGGGFGGKDPGLRNAMTTTVAGGAALDASGGSGSGGAISLWADGDTVYRGALSVAGGQRGGFAEVSGRNQLTFAGAVDLAGGTLLLDPVNVRIAQGVVNPGEVDADALVSAWNNGNVVVHTGGGGSEAGNIVVESNVNMTANSGYSLSLFAHNNITIAPNVATDVAGPTRILNRGTGNINLVAGWDGTGTGSAAFTSGTYPTVGGSSQAIGGGTPPALSPITAADILGGTYGNYGMSGAIELNPNAAHSVNVGSAGGQTNLFARDIVMAPGDVTNEYTQIGWFHNGTDAGGLSGVKGDINVYAKGNLVANNAVLPGTDWRYLQIGHGGRLVSATAGVQDRRLTGDITVSVAGGILAQSGGTNNGWFKIGHGGKADGVDTRVNAYGNINVTASGMTFQVNSALTAVNALADNFIQVGHGGINVRGEHAGNVNLTATSGDITVLGTRINQSVPAGTAADTVARNFFQVGHGGFNSDHLFALPTDFNSRSVVGDEITTIDELRQAVLDGEDLGGAYATALGLLSRRDGTGAYVPRTSGKLGHAGNISVLANGSITLEAGGRFQAYAQIGHGGLFTAGQHGSWNYDGLPGADGNISVVATQGRVALTRNMVEVSSAGAPVATLGTQAYVQVGHGGYFSTGGANGNVNVSAGGGNVSLYGGQSNAFAKIGHGGIANYDIGTAFVRGVREWNRDFAAGDILGNITVTASGDLIQRAGFRGSENFAQIGHGGYRIYATDDFLLSPIDVVKGNDMNGDGVSDTYGAFVGNITINAGGLVDGYAGQKNVNHVDGADPLLSGQNERGMAGLRNFVMIGHGGIEARADANGAINIISGGDTRMESTGGWDAFDANSALSGSTGDGDTGIDNFAMIGHGGRNSEHSLLRGDNPMSGDQRAAGLGLNSVESLVMFTEGGLRQLTKLSALTNTRIAAGRLEHLDGPIGWQVDVINPVAAVNRDGTNFRLLNLTGTDTVTSLNIALGTAVSGTNVPAGAVVTRIVSPTQFEISLATTAAPAAVTFLTNEAATTRLNLDNPGDRTVTALTPVGANGQNTLTLQGSETVRNLFLAIGSEVGGTGVPNGTYITGFSGPQTLTLSNNLTAAAAGNYTFASSSAVTTTSPLGAVSTNTLTLQGTDTPANLFLAVGSPVSGAGIAPGTKITGIAGQTLTLSSNLGAGATGVYSFGSSNLANQPVIGDRFGFENQTGVYQITGIERGTGANVGERLVTFQRVLNSVGVPGTGGLQARVANDTNLFFLNANGSARDPIQEQAGVGRNEVQSFNLPVAPGFTLEYSVGATTYTTAAINVSSATPMATAIADIDTALEAATGVANSNSFLVTPGPDGSIRIQFQTPTTGPAFGVQNVIPIKLGGTDISTVFDGVAAGNTSYLFTQLTAAPPGSTDPSAYINGTPTSINTPVFSSTVNPEFAEFMNTVNTPVNLALGWNGAITVNAGGNVFLTAAQRRNLETNPYAQANSPLVRSTTGTSITTVPQSAVRGFVQIGHGGHDSQMEGFLPNAGQQGDISVIAAGQVRVLASDFAQQIISGQTVTIATEGVVTTTTTADILPTTTVGTNVIDLHPNDTLAARNVGVGSSITGAGIVGGSAIVTEILGERRFRISANTNAALSGTYTFARNARIVTAQSSPDSRENYAMIGHGGVASANGALVAGNINVQAQQDVTVAGGRGDTAFAMIGHGGRDSATTNNNSLNRSTTFSGSINVASTIGGVAILAGSRGAAFAMVGHGGQDFDDTNVATVGPSLFLDNVATGGTQPTIITLNDPVFGSFLQNGVFSRNLGGTGSTVMRTDQSFEVATILGNVQVAAGGIHAGTGDGLTVRGGIQTSAISLSTTGDPVGDGTLGRFAQIGHGGANIDARIGDPAAAAGLQGDINVTVSGGNAQLLGGILFNDSARIGHGGRDFSGNTVAVGLDAGSSFYGNVTVNMGAGRDLLLKGGDAPLFDTDDDGVTGVNALVRHPLAYFYKPDSSVDDFRINPNTNAADVTALDNALRAQETIVGLTPGSFAGLTTADGVNQAALRRMGLIADRRAGRDSQLDGDPAFSLAPFQPSASVFYPTTLYTDGASIAQIGHGGSLIGGTGLTQGIERWQGNITVNSGATIGGVPMTGGNVSLLGGDGFYNFATIGHGGYQVRTGPITVTGDVTVNSANDLILEGGDYFANSGINNGGAPAANAGSYAQIGHMFASRGAGAAESTRSESSNGNIRATAVGDIILTGGGASSAQAMIGSGALAAISADAVIVPRGGHQGNITVLSGRDIILRPAEYREDDDISDAVYAAMGVFPVSRQRNPAQGTYSFAQIGHGGPRVSPTTMLVGDINVMAWGNLVAGGLSPSTTLTRTTYQPGAVSVPATLAADPSRGIGAYAKIGHGDYFTIPTGLTPPLPTAGRGLRSGTIAVSTGTDLWAAGLQIGHVDPVLAPSASYANTSSTYIAVSRRNPNSEGTGRLYANWSVSNYETVIGDGTAIPGGGNQTVLPTSFNSGSSSGDQVRIYMPDRAFGRGNGSVRG